MAKIGRPPALDPIKKRHFCALISIGCGIERAARSLGCSPLTLRRQANRDPVFAKEIQEARASVLAGPLRPLRQAADSNWRAASWFIERVHPEQFVKHSPRNITMDSAITMSEELLDAVLPKHTKARERARQRILRLIKLWDRDWTPGGKLRKRDRRLRIKRRKKRAEEAAGATVDQIVSANGELAALQPAAESPASSPADNVSSSRPSPEMQAAAPFLDGQMTAQNST